MGTTGSEVRAEIIGRVAAFAAKRLSREQLALFEPFAGQYYSRTDPADLAARQVPDLYGAAMAHLGFGSHRAPGEVKVRAYAPDLDRYGYVSPHSVVELVSEDMPFLVDSVSMELSRHGCGLHLVVHPMISVSRDAGGGLTAVLSVANTGTEEVPKPGTLRESYMHIEVDRETDQQTLQESSGISSASWATSPPPWTTGRPCSSKPCRSPKRSSAPATPTRRP